MSALFNNGIGFYKIPITKSLLGGVILTSCAFHVPFLANYRHYFVCNITDILYRFKFWKIILSKLAFYDIKDLVCGCLLLYCFRVFERRFGSHKFASYLLVSFTVSTLMEVALVTALNYFDIINIDNLFSGPFNLIFPLFVNYFFDIPRFTQTYLLGIPITGKSFAYLIGLQCVITSQSSCVCAISGLIAGFICRWNLFYICDIIKVPKYLASLSNRLFGWLLESKAPEEGAIQMGATLDIQRQQQIEIMEQQMIFGRFRELNQRNELNVFHNRRQNDLNTPPISAHPRMEASTAQTGAVNDNSVQTLVEMGFDRQNVVRALQRSNNDVNIATNILLSES